MRSRTRARSALTTGQLRLVGQPTNPGLAPVRQNFTRAWFRVRFGSASNRHTPAERGEFMVIAAGPVMALL